MLWAWQELQRTAGTVPIRELAARTDLGLRQLENRFRQQIGLPLKAVARVMRLQRALQLLKRGHDGAQDRAGLRILRSGAYEPGGTADDRVPPSRLLPAYTPHPSHPLTRNRVHGRVTTFQVPGSGPDARVPGHAPDGASQSAGRAAG